MSSVSMSRLNSRLNSGLGRVCSIRSAILASAALLLWGSAFAHHSPASFDTRKTATLTGVVKRFEWFNPHVYITIEQTTASGEKIDWEIECFPPSAMARLGWSKDTMRVGDVLTVTGSPSRNPELRGFLAGSIKRADQVMLDQSALSKSFSAGDRKFVAKGLEGTWMTVGNFSLISQFYFPPTVTMTPEGVQTFKNFDEKSMSTASNCIAVTAPGTMILPDLKRITLKDGVYSIEGEFDNGRRAIHLNEILQEGVIPSHQGHSVATWQGKTLVIESTHFAFLGSGNGLGLPSGPKKRLVEKLTLSDDGTSLTYRFELNDPEFLKAPRIGETKWVYRPDLKFASEPCNLESARRFIRH